MSRRRTAEHGTRSRYNGNPRRGQPGCRCDACREANRVWVTAWRRRRGVRPQRYGFTHGTSYGYKVCNGGYSKACQSCRDAYTAAQRRWRRAS